MHYRNGRPAQNGDKVVLIPQGGTPTVGILYDAKPGNDTCNGRLAPISSGDPYPNLKECLHIDDALALLNPPEAEAQQEPVGRTRRIKTTCLW
jgi:hypothetical protein